SVKVSSIYYNDVIKVKRFAGSETGYSNSFNVIGGSLDHFDVSTISSPQVSGVPFAVTITAKDAEGNVDSSFTGSVSLADLSNSISPQSSGSFVNGRWTGDLTVTTSKVNNKIFVSGNNKNGSSNPFDVNANVLHHFAFEEIQSPQIAGNYFILSISARDSFENIVTGFSSFINLSDLSGTVIPPATTNFSSGEWSGNVRITRKYENNQIIINEPSSGIADTTNTFNVKPDVVNHVVIRDNPGGLGVEVGAMSFNLNEQITLYAGGYDAWGNYVREVSADWNVTGNLDPPSPVQGTATVFQPLTPYTSGTISADSISLGADYTGTFTVASLDYILIRDEAAGQGSVVENLQLAADDSARFYAAAYDAGNNYLGPATVTWSNDGDLQPAVSGSDTVFVFYPTSAPTSGRISAVYDASISDWTGTISVVPGSPFGEIELHPEPKLISAHPDSFSTITSDIILDADGNPISQGEYFIISTSLGTITTPDEKPGLDGHWIQSNINNKIAFQINATTEGGTAFIHANSAGEGNAFGDTVLIISSLEIISVSTDIEKATLGQTNVPVRMVVKNIGTQTITIQSAGIDFTGPGPLYNDVTNKFNITRTDTEIEILSQTQAVLTFLADVQPDAPNENITIDGFIIGDLAGKSVSDTSAASNDEILIQSPPVLTLETVDTYIDTVIQGTNTTVTASYRNDGDASAVISGDGLAFWAVNSGLDVTDEYGQINFPSNPDTIKGHSTEIYSYTVQVGASATLDSISLRGSLNGSDVNTGNAIPLQLSQDNYHGWWVRQASDIEILEFSASQSTVTKDQTEDWFLTMVVQNSGGVDLRLDSVRVNFSLGGNDISHEYQIIAASAFDHSGDDTLRAGVADTLTIVVDRTGSTLGTVTIEGSVYLDDLISGQVVKSSATGVIVQAEAQLIMDFIHFSRTEVTTGQTSPWQIVVGLTNNGGGDIAVDSTIVGEFLTFKSDTSFSYSAANGFHTTGNFILKSGNSDSLFFIVDTTGTVAGNRVVIVDAVAWEINSQREISVTDSAEIKIENPSNVRLKEVKNIAYNSPYVDTDQLFQIQAIVENVGEDTAEEIMLSISSDSMSMIITQTQTISGIIQGNADTVLFDIQAFSSRISEEIFSIKIDSAVAENTPEPDKILISAPIDSEAVARIQGPGKISISSISGSVDTVQALSRETWQISITVRNDGEGTLTLGKPADGDIAVSINDEIQNDYTIIAPEGFYGMVDMDLSAGEEGVLIYDVTGTGFMGGNALFKASLAGYYHNSLETFEVSDSLNVYVSPSADVFIVNTNPVCLNIDQFGIGHVNIGQKFSVTAKIKNSGAEQVDNVIVTLDAAGYVIEPDTIDFISPGGDSTAQFSITALVINEQVEFMATIESAAAHESGLPASIGAASDSIAALRVHSSARLKIDVSPSDSIFTAGELGWLRLTVTNLGTAEVDESGLVSVKVPAGYLIAKGDEFVSGDSSSFVIDEELSWNILPPDYASGYDTVIVCLFKPPLDKNTNIVSLVENPFVDQIIKTVPSNIIINSFEIVSPDGAMDDTVSTSQDFYVKVQASVSENLDNIQGEIILPDGFGFGVGEDASKPMPQNYETWKLRAREGPTPEPEIIKIIVTGETDGQVETVVDSFAVTVVNQAVLVFDDIWVSWPSQTENTFSAGQEFDLSVLVKSKNANQADVSSNGSLRINFGSTGITTQNPLIKDFEVDGTVVWRLKAPDLEMGERPLTIFLESIPDDENTNQPAVVWGEQTRYDFYVETVSSANVSVENFRILSPIGATDEVLSTHQSFTVEAMVSWQNILENPTITLMLPAGFTTQESNPKQPGGTAQQGVISWTIQTPGAATQNQPIWMELSAVDANSGSPVVLTSDSIKVDIVNRAEIQLNAQIVSPQSALDQIVSLGDEFVISAFLTSSGDAGIFGSYSATITLPQGLGYSINQSMTKTASYNEELSWIVKAPFGEREAANINIEMISPPQDENTNTAVALDAIISKVVSIPITTEEKSVAIKVIDDPGRNTLARGDQSVPMMCLQLSVSGDEYSNNVLFSGVKVKLKDRFGNLLENPRNAISKLSVVDGTDGEKVFAQVSDIPSTNPINISFFALDTLKPGILNLVDFKLDVAENASVTDFSLAIDSSLAFQMSVEGSGRTPKVTDDSGQELDAMNLTSLPAVIVEASLSQSFSNYPNPFGTPARPTTFFVYYLEQDTDVTVNIYTLVGELVTSKSYSMNQPQGRKGLRNGDITWDGRNDKGYKVLNGVYIARISTGDGKQSIRKIAVIK
ncbi:hypothetical protein B6I21_00220, partial [candidate division KSB1 bacterium 4572_119]